jgi:cell division protein FtsZ
LERLLNGLREVIILTGLGGGTGSAFVVPTIRLAKSLGVRTLVVCTLPFSFETSMRQETARRVLGEIRAEAEGVVTLANDRALAWPCSRDNIRHSYHVLNQLTAQGVESLAQIVHGSGMTPLEYEDVQSVFGCGGNVEISENCWIGVGEVETAQGVEELVQTVMDSPLMAEADDWRQADTCLACLVGGPDMSLITLQQLTKALEKRTEGRVTVRLGAKLHPSYQGRLKLSLLMAATAGTSQLPVPELLFPVTPVKAPASKPAKVRSKVGPVVDEQILPVVPPPQPEAEVVRSSPPMTVVASGKKKSNKQEELQFDANRGRFDKSFETIYRGENLDQPTFRRRKLAIKV